MTVTKPNRVKMAAAGCPYCASPISATEDIQRSGNPRSPQDGDIAVCFACTKLSTWRTTTMGYVLEAMSEAEQSEAESLIPDFLVSLRDFNEKFPPSRRYT